MKENVMAFEVRCAHCEKPFHLTATPKPDVAGEEEIVLNCPYCNKPITVAVPRVMVETATMMRSLSSSKQAQ